MTEVRLTLIGKPGCHLCDDARAVVTRVMDRFAANEGQRRAPRVQLEELNILEDPTLARQHSEDIPVVLINDVRHAIWFVDETKLEAAIDKVASKRRFF